MVQYRYQKQPKNKNHRIVIAILLVLIGFLFYDTFIQKNIIAVMTIEGGIFSTEASAIINTLDSLEKNSSVKAIVLKINSPGGGATAIHDVYFKLLKVKSVKPIVTSVDAQAASGAYYIASTTDYIVAKQSSELGSIGVIAELPKPIDKTDLITSGPFKNVLDEDTLLRMVDLLKKDFLEAVKSGRKDKLKIDPVELTSAKVYIGFDAKRIGLIDEIGGLDDAVKKAKELAGLRLYSVETVRPFPEVRYPLFISSSHVTSNSTTVPAFYYLFVKLEE